MKNQKHIWILAALAIVFASCETRLDLGPVANRNRLVVNALVNNQDAVAVQVSSTIPLGSKTGVQFIENATVTVREDNGTTYNLVYNIGTNKYEGTLKLQPGKFYAVSVKASGFLEVSSELVMPEQTSPVKSTWRDSADLDSSGFPTGLITVRLNDKPGTRNYYRISLFYYDDILAEWKSLKPNTRDADIAQNAIEAKDGSWVFSDQSFDGEQKRIEFITPFGFSFITPKFLVIKESLSENYFRYFNSLRNYQEPGGVFTEATPVFSNIKNGVGIWAGSSLSRDTIR